MEKRYVTLGQCHAHSIGGKTFDKDSIAVVEGNRETVFELFGPKFCFEYTEEEWAKQVDKGILDYFPRGCIKVNF